MAKKLIIKGVGSLMARRADVCPGDTSKEEYITLGSIQNLRIDFNVEMEDIFGGDGVFPIDDLVRNKSIEISATDAKFDLDALSLILGDEVKENVEDYLWSLNEIKTVVVNGDGIKTVTLNYPLFKDSENDIQMRKLDTNEVIPNASIVARTEGDTTILEIDDTESILKKGDRVYVNYKFPAVVSLMDMLSDSVPYAIYVVHHGVYPQKCGKRKGIETELFACKPTGTYSIDAQRRTATASTINFKLIDPEMPCGRVGRVKVFELPKVTCRE